MCACLAVSVSLLLPRLASRVTSAVRANARNVASIYLSIYLCRTSYGAYSMPHTPIPGSHWLSGQGMVVSTCLESDCYTFLATQGRAREGENHTLPAEQG